jgi:hypothetical protein
MVGGRTGFSRKMSPVKVHSNPMLPSTRHCLQATREWNNLSRSAPSQVLLRAPQRRDLAVPDPSMVADVGSAPCVMAALAGVVHDRESTAGHKHDCGEDYQ